MNRKLPPLGLHCATVQPQFLSLRSFIMLRIVIYYPLLQFTYLAFLLTMNLNC
ncbi:hypothetical protein BDN72DRAFT_847931 [Pluteus cervinus]|uniref:Uncharacterized protein n=1 Tax=Pluteus cervinus TaxID=181527 RepID=A0ACD3AC57_9AGAR|nr:hypothetical protein BDN72DRAFT_847931 [Pluteus cervinus]